MKLIQRSLIQRPFIMIALGGALGALSRFYLNVFIEADSLLFFNSFNVFNFDELFEVLEMPNFFAIFPLGILLINMIGSFFLAVFITYMQYTESSNIALRNFVAVGFLGSFTTFSTFIMDSLKCLVFFVMNSAAWQKVFPHLKTISYSFERHFSFSASEFLLSHSLLFAISNILLNLILCLVCVGVGYKLVRKRYEVGK